MGAVTTPYEKADCHVRTVEWDACPETAMSSAAAPNVSGVGAPGRRTVYGMCGMCAVRCPIEVTVEDGRVTWLQGNPNDRALGTSLCAKGAAGLSLEFDDERPQSPLIRSGPRGSGQWRRASWDEALDYVADKLKETIEVFGGRGIALSDRGGPFNDLTRTFVQALGSPNYFNHDAGCGGNVHNAARSIYGFGHEGLIPDLPRVKHLVLYGRNIVESLMVKEAKAFMSAVANGMRVTYIDPRATITASKATRYWQVRPNSDYALNLALIHEVLRAGGLRRGLRRPLRLRHGLPARCGRGHDAGVAGAPHRRSCRPVARVRRGDRRRRAARDLPSGLDVGPSQAVVPRQPLAR